MRLKREYVSIPEAGKTEAGLRPALRSIRTKATRDHAKAALTAEARRDWMPEYTPEFSVESPGGYVAGVRVANVEATMRDVETAERRERKLRKEHNSARMSRCPVGTRCPWGTKTF